MRLKGCWCGCLLAPRCHRRIHQRWHVVIGTTSVLGLTVGTSFCALKTYPAAEADLKSTLNQVNTRTDVADKQEHRCGRCFELTNTFPW